ncbi:MAG: sodium:proton antiporter [Phycisphaerae bacterium]|nr:sodium:proton antiporter [Phycisphaerae bacterium]
MIDQSNLRQALSTVQDPESGRDLVSLGVLREITLDQELIRIELDVQSTDEAVRGTLRSGISAAVRKLAAEQGLRRIPEIEIEFLSATATPNPLPLVRSVIAVGAGKGGVGKSTVSVHLALALARMGRKVGILDGDIYGPSLPTMLGLDEIPPKIDGNTIIPFEKHGLKIVSIGRLVEPEKALVWRGPMAHGAFRQLALQSDWGELDHLIVDLPPGTGDVPLTLAQLLPLTGAVVVCTPQKVAQDDARRAIRMFQQLGVSILGVVENMAGFTAPDGSTIDLFGRGGAEDMAAGMSLPFLGRLPIHPELAARGDAGEPSFCHDLDGLGEALRTLGDAFDHRIRMAERGEDRPTLAIR